MKYVSDNNLQRFWTKVKDFFDRRYPKIIPYENTTLEQRQNADFVMVSIRHKTYKYNLINTTFVTKNISSNNGYFIYYSYVNEIDWVFSLVINVNASNKAISLDDGKASSGAAPFNFHIANNWEIIGVLYGFNKQ